MNRITILSVFIALCIPITASIAQWSDDSTHCTTICNLSGDQGYPQIASDGAGGAIMVWQDGRSSSDRIYAQRIDSSGIVRWTANGILICDATNSRLPQIVSDGAGGAIVTWFDKRTAAAFLVFSLNG
jgi:hypothetical protein